MGKKSKATSKDTSGAMRDRLYRDAHLQWKKLAPMDLDAERRLSRDDAHSRRADTPQGA